MMNKQKTHCIHGHEYTPGNTVYEKDGSRKCRICKNTTRRNWTKTHREQISEQKKQYYQKNKNKWHDYNIKNRLKINERRRERYNEDLDHRKKILAFGKKHRQKPESRRRRALRDSKRIREMRKFLIVKLGGKCNICGFNDLRALQLDHIQSDGYLDKKRFKNQELKYKFYIQNFDVTKQKLQVLCANHNCIKRIEKFEFRTIHLQKLESFSCK